MERFTSIGLPGCDNWIGGFAERGAYPVDKLIADHRERAAKMKADAEAVLAAADADFRIETYRGAYVMRDLKVIQPGRPKP